MNLIDTHSHLFLKEFDDDLDKVIERANGKGIRKIILPNIDSTSIDRLLATCSKYPSVCYPAMGLHPTSVDNNFEKELEIVDNCLDSYFPNLSNNTELSSQAYELKAIGETGLDLYWDKTYFEQQKEAFRRQALLAIKYKLPIIIHSRNSTDEIIELLEEINNPELFGIFHCFPGNRQQADKAISLGFKLGIGGVITFKNSGLQEVVKHTDLKHIVLETDSPYLAPEPYRGKRNESSYIWHIASRIAIIKEISIDEVAEITSNNAMELFYF